MNKNVIIIGSGPAGYTAAIYTSRAKIYTTLITGEMIGGQLTQTLMIENYPGFSNGIKSFELLEEMRKQAERFGTQIIYDTVSGIEILNDTFNVHTINKQILNTNAIIVASGAQARWLPIPNMEKYLGKGYHGCAVCDGAFYKDKNVIVVGGGDTAFEDALYLTKFASKVYLIHRSDKYRASKILQEEVFLNKKIEIINFTELVELKGQEYVEIAVLKNNQTNEIYEINIDAVFCAIGRTPSSAFLPSNLQRDENGFIKKISGNMTNIEGIFVAGDVANPGYQQAIIAAGDGARAAIDVNRWFEKKYK